MIDYCGMKHLFGQPTLNAKKTRWLEFLSEYDFEIKNIKGKENKRSMYSIGELMKCILWPLACTTLL